jgi:diguanylate cyclase (GGDEF)-like protein
MGDVNGLKITNDVFGHQTGDLLLKGIADVLKKVCRAEDMVARWGGDEFVIFLPQTSEKMAGSICESIKKSCTDCGIYSGPPVPSRGFAGQPW